MEYQNETGQEQKSNSKWAKYALALKVLSIGFIILLLLIPKAMISGLIDERSGRQQEAMREVGQKWGSAQRLTGPFLLIPYKYSVETNDGFKTVTRLAYFLPENLKIDGKLQPDIRKRGIYKIPVYIYDGTVTGHFEKPDFSEWEIPESDILYNQAKIVMGITDLSGINEEVFIKWNGKDIKLQPGVPTNTVTKSGIHTLLPAADTTGDFAIHLSLNGSSMVSFAPVGESTEATLESSWNSPSFTGRFIPDKREITKDGFTAFWKILSLNRNYPQRWTSNSTYSPDRELFSVQLFQSVDHYKLNTRTVKYAIIIILLVFTTFFFFEILKKQNIHVFQYILVGLAISIFYLLLLSFSEHLGFNRSYLIASIAVIGLILLYTSAILSEKKLVWLLGLALSGVFGFIFIILQMEDYALLAGSLGLFLVLATVMLISRKVNWYQLKV